MALRKGLPAKLALTDADDTRYDFRNLVVCNADGSPRGGVTSPVGVSLVSSTATMNVSVGAFSAIAARDGGAILLANDGPTNVLLPAAPASNSRIDVIWAKQNDASSTVVVPDANNNALLSSTQGNPSATPTKPAIPTGAVELATVLIPSGATATNSSSPAVVITQTAAFTAAPGGKVPFRTLTDLQAWTTANPGQTARILGVGSEYTWSGTQWLPSGGAMAGGRVIRTGGAGNFTGSTWNVLNNTSLWQVDQPALDIAAFNGTWVAPFDGVYDVELGIRLDTVVAALLAVTKNDALAQANNAVLVGSGQGTNGFTGVSTRGRLRLSAGDVLRGIILPSALAAWSTVPGSSYFGIRYVEPLR